MYIFRELLFCRTNNSVRRYQSFIYWTHMNQKGLVFSLFLLNTFECCELTEGHDPVYKAKT